jgi:hypothetical protein
MSFLASLPFIMAPHNNAVHREHTGPRESQSEEVALLAPLDLSAIAVEPKPRLGGGIDVRRQAGPCERELTADW